MVAAGAYIITEQQLKDDFDGAKSTSPINPKFKNKLSMKLDFELTFDGINWTKASIPPKDYMKVESGNKRVDRIKI